MKRAAAMTLFILAVLLGTISGISIWLRVRMGPPVATAVMTDQDGNPLSPEAAARALADATERGAPRPSMQMDQAATAQEWERRRVLKLRLNVVAGVAAALATVFFIGGMRMRRCQHSDEPCS